MAITQPVPITAAPPVPDSSVAEPTFDAQYEAFNGWEANTLVPGANALGANVYANAQQVEELAGSTTSAAQTATQQADLAMGYRNTANQAAGNATTQAVIATDAAAIATAKRNEAVAAADLAVPAANTAGAARDQAVAAAAQAGAPLVASSTSSLTVGVATQNLNVGLGKGFAPGQTVTIARVAAPATVWMRGTVLTYSSTGAGPLSVAVAEVAGAGTFADWSISVAGNRGASSLTLPVVGVAVATTGAANVFYRIDAPVELKMPATPNDGDFFAFANRSGAVPTINPNGKKIKGDSSILSLNTLNASACLKYDAANGDWVESFAGYTVASVSSNAILLQPNTWTAKQTLQGFTALGDSAPSIKQKLFSGVMPATAQNVYIPLGGIDFRKIVGICTLFQGATFVATEGNTVNTGYQFATVVDSSSIYVQPTSNNSANLLSRPFTVLVTHIE